MVVEVIPLSYRTAEQLIPVLKPLLARDASISGMQNQLVIRTTPANLAEVRKVLATLDAAPRQLLITVRHDAAGTADGATVLSTRTLDSDLTTRTVQVVEGNRAFIQTGQTVAVPHTDVAGFAGQRATSGQLTGTAPGASGATRGTIAGGQVSGWTEYRDVMSGFYILPRVSGDRVTLELDTQHDTAARPEQNLAPGSANRQHAATVVSGRLGEWIEVGSVARSASEQGVILGSTRSVSAQNRRILIKVDEIR